MSLQANKIAELRNQLAGKTGAEKAHANLRLAAYLAAVDKVEAAERIETAMQIANETGDRGLLSDCYTVASMIEEQKFNSEQAIVLLEKAAELGKGLEEKAHELAARQKLGLHKLRQHKIDEAGKHFMYCLETYNQLPDTMIKWEGQHFITLYLMQVDVKAATELALKNRAMLLRIGTNPEFIQDLHNLARIAEKTGDIDKAIEYNVEALRVKDELKDDANILHTARRVGLLYLQKGDKENALKYFLREVNYHNSIALEERRVFVKTNDAITYYYAGKTEEAEQLCRLALEIAEAESNQRKLGSAQFQMGHLCFLQGRYADAIPYLEKSLITKGESIPPDDHITTCRLLHQCYEAIGNHKDAYAALKKLHELEKAQLDQERVKQIAHLNMKFESEKREAELSEMKIKQQQTELERTDSELKAIKAQMNPHFIFNALNSIQEMFFIGDKRLANEHLGKFSQLTRQILKASGRQFVTLSEEIDMLNKYLELEGLRFESDFTFSITLNNNDAADDILLPPMLVQPYVENAIRHGLLHKQGNKNVSIDFDFNEGAALLTCTITDNGIGREAADAINKSRKQLHDSFSTSANARRLELLNQHRNDKIGVRYEDASAGTRVVITIPVSY